MKDLGPKGGKEDQTRREKGEPLQRRKLSLDDINISLHFCPRVIRPTHFCFCFWSNLPFRSPIYSFPTLHKAYLLRGLFFKLFSFSLCVFNLYLVSRLLLTDSLCYWALLYLAFISIYFVKAIFIHLICLAKTIPYRINHVYSLFFLQLKYPSVTFVIKTLHLSG